MNAYPKHTFLILLKAISEYPYSLKLQVQVLKTHLHQDFIGEHLLLSTNPYYRSGRYRYRHHHAHLQWEMLDAGSLYIEPKKLESYSY